MIQTVLLNREDKVQIELEAFENFESYYAKFYEVGELLGKKTKEFEILLESYNKLKDSDMQVTSGKSTYQVLETSLMARTSPSGLFKTRDSEVQKLQIEIQLSKKSL